MNNEYLFIEADKQYELRNFKLAFELFLKAAEQGDPSSMSRLGCLYSDGEGVPVDYEKSIEWDLKAIEQGEESSMLNLAITFRMAGELSKASHWFRKALKFGNGEAALELAKHFMASDKDQQYIRKYLTIASKHQNICEDSRREATELLSKLDTTS